MVDLLHCGRQKAVNTLRELQYAGLVEIQKQGCGKPNRIFPKSYEAVPNTDLRMPNINPRIRSLDDLLGVARKVENTAAAEDKPAQPANNGFQILSPEAIRGFRGHPFRLYEGDRLNDLVESISENGVLVPAIVRKIESDENGFEYEMLAGHNRQNAAVIAHRELPCIVKENLSDHDAWIYVIETNVLQRSFSEMLPSEKAAVLALRYSKMICQGRRNDIIEELKRLGNPDEIKENKTCGIDCHKSKSRDVVGAE